MDCVQDTVFALLYRDGWASASGPPLTTTFLGLGLTDVDLHLLQFELQMTFCIAITDEAGVQLTNSVAELLTLVERRLASVSGGSSLGVLPASRRA
ncbi:hypothetical protein [uncultured Hymenobacter sp.]|uniref:hypothetical protein n=1 Tax=uncultured Hymenobacter sp. TaxID=170016 RepID=UPI0035CC7A0D